MQDKFVGGVIYVANRFVIIFRVFLTNSFSLRRQIVDHTSQWVSAPRRQELWESMEPDMVPLSVKL